MSLTKFDANTTFKTIIVKQPEAQAKKSLAKIILEIPTEFDLKIPEGHQSIQVENMIDFIMKHFKTISPNQIKEAIELNAAMKFERKIESYGKFTREFMGSVLHEFVNWRASQRRRGSFFMLELNVNVPQELFNDWKRININPDLTVNAYVNEKFEHLAGAGQIDATIPGDQVNKIARQIEKDIQDPKHTSHKFKDFVDPKIWAISDIKAETIKNFLLHYKPQIKRNHDQKSEGSPQS